MFGFKKKKQTPAELEREILKNPDCLSLSGLDIMDLSTPPEHPYVPTVEEGIFRTLTQAEFDAYMINDAIFYHSYVAWVSDGVDKASRTHAEWNAMQRARERELFGDRYEELQKRRPQDPRVWELLLQDAIKTGKWKPLPDELWREYHERMGLEYPPELDERAALRYEREEG